MDRVIPRLHSEFFTLRLRIEDFFRNVAFIEDDEFRPILDTSTDNYVNDSKHPYHKYLLSELMLHPDLYRISIDNGLLEILETE
jgi:hypothetical protein